MPGRDTVNQQEKKPFHRVRSTVQRMKISLNVDTDVTFGINEPNGGYIFEFSNHWSFVQRISYLHHDKSVHWNDLVLGLRKGMEGANLPDSVHADMFTQTLM
ncbi:hypothetical protein CEXT_28651 [Caerostris extrusa]|uniref:Uncharacterized protein n=1 Tax=Caerostris extrusa TaxID=172846 RepID=A0AAV4MAY0_CAEEX|nr:hypothetical protein CEXT_28651 [Caerostris extrusa]